MAELIDQSSRPTDEKAVIQHHENSGSSMHSGQNKVDPGLEEAMYQSEMDTPVGLECPACCCGNADSQR